MLFINGKFYTKKGFKEAALIKDGFFQDIGSTKELLKSYPDRKVINLGGRLVLPGFNDSHLHLLTFARFKEAINLQGVKTKEEIILKAKIALKNKKILVLYNYDDRFFPTLGKNDLDQISRSIPILAYRTCGHIACLNTFALNLLPKYDGDLIDYNLGILKEDALGLLEDLYPNLSIQDLKEKISNSIRYFNSFGITSFSTNDLKDDLSKAIQIIKAYQELENENLLNARISLQFSFTEINKITEILKYKMSSPYLRLGPLKLFVDGSLGGKTALLSEPYADGSFGIQTINTKLLEELFSYSKKQKLQLAIHSIGDRATEICLDAFEKIEKNDLRHFLIHLQVLRPDLLEKISKLKVLASVQPIFIEEDLEMAKLTIPSKLLRSSYLLKTLFKTTRTSFSSDSPYGGLNPFWGIKAALTQSNLEGELLNKEETISILDAIDAYTINSAYLTFEEMLKGKIEIGYYADFIVLSDDVFLISSDEIRDTEVLMTVVGGKIVYQRREI